MTTSHEIYPEPGPEQERFWRDHVTQWRRSGQSQSEYCRSRELSVHRLRWWKAKFERLGVGAGQPALIPVQVQPSQAEPPRTGPDAGVRIRLGERVCVEVTTGFDRVTLAAVMQVLGG